MAWSWSSTRAPSRGRRSEAALTRLELFGGKGGTGKTTCAAARALAAAEGGSRVLAVSTDPAHSLADALDLPVPADDGVHEMPLPEAAGRLRMAHAQAARAWERWLGPVRASLRRIAEGGTYLQAEDIDRLLALPVPGADELVGLLEIVRISGEAEYDLVVVDSAPTAQMFRLLESPAALERLARLLLAMQRKRRTVAEALTGMSLPTEDDTVIEGILGDADTVARRLRDADGAGVRWVTLAERLPLLETRAALRRLAGDGIHVVELIFNRVLPAARENGLRGRARAAQREVLRRARREIPDLPFRIVPDMPEEPRGRVALRVVADHLEAPAALPEVDRAPARGGADVEATERGPAGGALPAWLQALAATPRTALLFGGKGGTGKSTCAAAVACCVAAAGNRPVVLVSTDPAQSLRALLDGPGPDGAAPPPGLELRQLDTADDLRRWRARHAEALAGLLRRATDRGGAEATLDREVIERFLDTPPPGTDEILALASLVEIEEEAGSSLVICDTAPTGHALRLLRMPEVGLAWDHALMEVLLRYREVLPLGDLAEELVRLSRRLRRFRDWLGDASRCGLVVVTRAGRLVALETGRLLASLSSLRIEVPALVINAVGPDVDVERVLGEQRRALPAGGALPCDILLAPERQPPPDGAADLARWARTWSVVP